ncbi:hypothetical protein F4604DRAFT_1661163 [Suillus subluteus]|nr:hypothetical protein F4604DRAFT_1661163 [Suillus subluteus]
MAIDFRSARSSSDVDWDDNELMAYNITVTAIPPQQFFPQGTDVPLTVTGLDPALATADSDVHVDADVSASTLRFLVNLRFVTTIMPDHEPSIDAFARDVLITAGFQQRRFGVLTAYQIPFCYDIDEVAQISICLKDFESKTLLLLQTNKTQMGPSNVEARMIAGAIAAYQFNNNNRQEMGLHPLDVMTMPCITMVGLRPTFYLVPVTKALSDAVISGQYPSDRTEVLKCEVASDYNGGMEAPEYRVVALQYYVAFRSLAKSHWERFLS